ncbi:hypothetical protein [Halosimplex halophilum]
MTPGRFTEEPKATVYQRAESTPIGNESGRDLRKPTSNSHGSRESLPADRRACHSQARRRDDRPRSRFDPQPDQGLKTLNLVAGIPGPSGGYEPTEHAFTVLDRDRIDDHETVTLSGNCDRIDVTVDEIDFTNVHHPEECTAHVALQQAASGIEAGDPVAIGPTPLSNLVIAGK